MGLLGAAVAVRLTPADADGCLTICDSIALRHWHAPTYLKTTKALGLTVSQALLARADEVIE